MPGNSAYGLYYSKTGSDGSLWVPLIEKAYVELREQTGVDTGGDPTGNNYNDINGGGSNGLASITGQQSNAFSAAASNAAQLISQAVASKQNVMMASENTVDGLVADHMYTVTAYDAATNSVTLRNPWGTGAGSNGA